MTGAGRLHRALQRDAGDGQGIATSTQLADIFDVPIERIRILQGDTDRARAAGSGSCVPFIGGSAVRLSARAVRARELAGEALEVPAADLELPRSAFHRRRPAPTSASTFRTGR